MSSTKQGSLDITRNLTADTATLATDLSVSGTLSQPVLYANSATHAVGINTDSPTERFHVVGSGLVDGDLTVSDILSSNSVSITTSVSADSMSANTLAATSNLTASGIPVMVDINRVENNVVFGDSAVNLNIQGASDALGAVNHRSSTGNAGIRRGFTALMEVFTTLASHTRANMALNGFAYVDSSSTGNLTRTAEQGGLTAGRYACRHGGSGTVSLASSLASRCEVDGGSEDGTITTGVAYLVEAQDGGAGTGSITDAYGFLARDVVGNITNANHIRLEELTGASGDNFEIFLEGGGGIFFRAGTQSITSPSAGVLNATAPTTINLNINTQAVATVDSDGFVVASGVLGLNTFDNTGKDAIGSPQTGWMIFNTTSGTINVYDGTTWRELAYL